VLGIASAALLQGPCLLSFYQAQRRDCGHRRDVLFEKVPKWFRKGGFAQRAIDPAGLWLPDHVGDIAQFAAGGPQAGQTVPPPVR